MKKWPIQCAVNGRKKTVQVHIWDFGGQEIYHATHQFFLTPKSIYLFVWEARREEHYRDFDYWFSVINLLSDDSPILVVMNKSDERTKEIDHFSLQEKYPNIVGFYRISCLTDDGVQELTDKIIEIASGLSHIGDVWPGVWVDVRNQIEVKKCDYIHFSGFKKLCQAHGLNETNTKFLSAYLHQLGVLLHFQDDKILKNTVILDPEWGTDAIYQVLDTRQVQDQKGTFSFQELETIWDSQKYPSEKHIELLQLMIKFELCFQIQDSENYIVPELLPAERVAYNWTTTDNLCFEYHFPFMPAGILSRFIARNHAIIHANCYWKNGVILERDKSRALVIDLPLDRKIKIAIDGPFKRELLGMIRNEFDLIFKSLNNIAVDEMIPCFCEVCREDAKNPHLFNYATIKKFIEKGKKVIPLKKVQRTSIYMNWSEASAKRKIQTKTLCGDTCIFTRCISKVNRSM